MKVRKEHIERVRTRAMWIGIATAEANDFARFPFKDSEASRWRADAAQRARSNAKHGKDGRRRRVPLGRKLTIAMSNGGHDVVKASTGKRMAMHHLQQEVDKEVEARVEEVRGDG